MLVFLRRIPAKTSKKEILEFITAAVKGGFLSKRGSVTNISFIERQNPQYNIMDHHAVVTIEPDSVAERVIEKMNRKSFKGKFIEVRRYYNRDPANDPRNKNRMLDEVPDSRRQWERRQKLEAKETVAEFVAIKNSQRKG